MTIAKGQPWGAPGRLPEQGVVVRSDAAAASALESARRDGRPFPTLGLLGGDLARTLGGAAGLAVRFPIDVGEVRVDGRLHLFVAHVAAHGRTWRRSVVAMNAQWLGPWNLGPKAHPNDGLLDISDARLSCADLPKVRARARLGAHLPHPRIRLQRTGAAQVDLERPLPVFVDGVCVGRGRQLAFRALPDALTVFV